MQKLSGKENLDDEAERRELEGAKKPSG